MYVLFELGNYVYYLNLIVLSENLNCEASPGVGMRLENYVC